MKTFEQIIEEVFKVAPGGVNDGMSSKDIPDWDSMNYLFLIAELEKRFGMSFTMDEVVNAQNVGDLRKAVLARATTP